MDLKLFSVVFTTVFLAELGDKTQLATVLFAIERNTHPALVFAAASCALVTSTGLAVFLGTVTETYLSRFPLKIIAGIGFMLIGLWTVYKYFADA